MPDCFYDDAKASATNNEVFRIGGIVDNLGADFQQMGQSVSSLNTAIYDLISAVNVDNTSYKRDKFKEQGRFFCNILGLIFSHINNLSDWNDIPYSRNTLKLNATFTTQNSNLWMDEPVHEVFTELQPEDLAENGKPILWKFDTGDVINTYGSYEGWISFTWYDRNRKSSSRHIDFSLQTLLLTAVNTLLLSSNDKGKKFLDKLSQTSSFSDFVTALSSNPPETCTKNELQEELVARTYINSCLSLPMSLIDTLIDARDMINSEISNWQQQSELEKIEKTLEIKNFNRLLGDALNYASSSKVDFGENSVVERNDQTYYAYDDDGGLPALVNHRHYDFSKFLRVGSNPSCSNKFYLSREMVKLLNVNFFNREDLL